LTTIAIIFYIGRNHCL